MVGRVLFREYCNIAIKNIILPVLIAVSCENISQKGVIHLNSSFIQNSTANSLAILLEQELFETADKFGVRYSGKACVTKNLTKVDSAATVIRRNMINRTPEEIICMLNAFVYETWGIVFSSDRNDLENMLPGCVLHNRKGSCIGISALYLLLAEKLSLPIYGFVVPGHFFVQYDDSVYKRNIESLENGEHRDESWYEEYFGSKGVRISSRELTGLIFYNIGNIYLQSNDIPMALEMYRSALDKDLRLAQCWGNYAIAHEKAGSLDSALHYIIIAGNMDPDLKGIQESKALLLSRAGRFKESIEIYKKLLQSEQENPDLYYDLAWAYTSLNNKKEARKTIHKLMEISKDYPGIETLLRELN